MKTNINKISESKIELNVEISSEEFSNFIKKAIQQIGKDLEVKGFRKGKAPEKVVEEKVGEEEILTTAANMAIKEKYSSLVSEKEVEPVGQPQVEILKMAKGNPFKFKIKAQVLPEIDLPDYKKIVSKAKKRKVSVEQKEIEDALNWLQKSRASLTPKEREAKKGDFVEIEYESPQIKMKQKPDSSEESKIKDRFLLGKGHFIPGFEEKLVGMKNGDKKEFSLTFPKKFQRKDLAGKKADFKVKMKAVKKMDLPEINDEFAAKLGNFTDLKSLKENIRGGIKTEKEIKEKQRLRSAILDKIAAETKFEIPENLVEFEKKRLFNNLKAQVTQNLNISFEDYLSSIKKTEKEIRDSLSKEAEKKVRNFLILREIAKEENIEVGEEEIKEKTEQTLNQYTPEQREKVDVSQLKEYTKGALYNEKVFQKLESFIKNN